MLLSVRLPIYFSDCAGNFFVKIEEGIKEEPEENGIDFFSSLNSSHRSWKVSVHSFFQTVESK